MGSIEDYYNCQYDEWGRLERHRIEFEMTRRVLDEYIDDYSKVLDVGGGPGRYSIYLAQKGHTVTLFDLSEKLVEQAEENAKNAGVFIEKFIKGNVLELDRVLTDKYYDAVLCMGPLYHLLEEDERRMAIEQCQSRLKPGGVLIAAFISAYAPIVDLLKYNPKEIKVQKDWLLKLLSDGRSHGEHGFTDAYFIKPENIEVLFKGFKLETVRIMAAEGLGALREDIMKSFSEEDFQEWMELLYKISDHNAILGSCEHLLYIGRKVG